MPKIKNLIDELHQYVDNEKARIYPRFFKSGPGEYGDGDRFIGVTVPNCRIVARRYSSISLKEIKLLLKSKTHEERLVALLILVHKFAKGNLEEKEKIYRFYLTKTNYINNWDLVDLSSTKIVGEYLIDKPKSILLKLSKSKNLWERRIAIVSTYAFIRKGNFDQTLKISRFLLKDTHDLIHKAVGWMLREVGKKNQEVLEIFLRENYGDIPRTTLRYAIERFPEEKRLSYLNKSFRKF